MRGRRSGSAEEPLRGVAQVTHKRATTKAPPALALRLPRVDCFLARPPLEGRACRRCRRERVSSPLPSSRQLGVHPTLPWRRAGLSVRPPRGTQALPHTPRARLPVRPRACGSDTPGVTVCGTHHCAAARVRESDKWSPVRHAPGLPAPPRALWLTPACCNSAMQLLQAGCAYLAVQPDHRCAPPASLPTRGSGPSDTRPVLAPAARTQTQTHVS